MTSGQLTITFSLCLNFNRQKSPEGQRILSLEEEMKDHAKRVPAVCPRTGEQRNQSRGSRLQINDRTEWSPIRSVIIRVINKVRTTAKRSLIC